MKNYLKQIISKNLLYYRQKRGLSQEQLAEMADISQSFYAKIESGSRLMGIEVLYRLAQSLNISVDTLLGMNALDANIENIVVALQSKTDSEVEAAVRILLVVLEEMEKVQSDSE